MLISEAFDFYCSRFLIMRGRSNRTVENYRNTKGLFLKFLGDLDVECLTFSDVSNFYKRLSSYQSNDTVANNMIRLRCVIRVLSKSGLNVLDYSELPVPSKQKRLVSYLTYSDFNKFICFASQRCRGYKNQNRLRNVAVCNLLFYSGIRISELCSLDRDSIHDRSFVVVGKSKFARVCFINKITETSINEYLSSRSDSNKALFVNSYGNRLTPDVFRKSLALIARRNGFFHVHPHMFRHGFASYLFDKQVDLVYISDLLGHQSLDTTKIYTHYKNTKLQQIYDKVVL